MGLIGIVANPASGKDVRRLVARASVFDNQEKQAIVQRLLVGAGALEKPQVLYMADPHGIVAGGLEEVGGFCAKPVPTDETGTAFDTIVAARAFKAAACDVVITLGGDGTNRAFALGWHDPALIPLSTGTNNVFPNLAEATVAGAAAGLIASGTGSVSNVTHQHKMIRVEIEGERNDLALIDAVLSRERFVGARALLDPTALELALLTRAEPAAVGMTTLGGLLQPVSGREDVGLLVELATDAKHHVNAPIAPGYYRDVGVTNHRTVPFGETIHVEGPGVLAFDGERERRLMPGQRATLTVQRDGPRIVDIEQTLAIAAERGVFRN